MYSITYPASWMKTDYLTSEEGKESMRKLLDTIVSPHEFNTFLQSLKREEVPEEEESIDWIPSLATDISNERMRVYHFGMGDSLAISMPESVIENEEGHVVRALTAEEGTVYNTYYINKPWRYIAVYGKKTEVNNEKEAR